MQSFLQRRWFLVALAVLIPAGLTLGMNVADDGATALFGRLGPLPVLAIRYFPRIATAVILFLMSFSLETRQLQAAFRSPGPIVWASLLNYGFIPVLAWLLMGLQQPVDFALGLMIAASVPCTMAAASVWTRKARGNDAVSLMVTLVTNTSCFAMTPLWLHVTTGRQIKLDSTFLMIRLLSAVLVPSLLGQLLRQIPRPAAFATKHKTPIGVAAQSLILVVVFYAACKAGSRLNGSGSNANAPGVRDALVVWATCIGVHLAAMFVGLRGSRVFGFSRADTAAVAFAASQKTLPIGILLATDPTMFGDPNLLGPGLGAPFAVFPMLMYHASQLFIDTAVADRLAAGLMRTEQATTDTDEL